MKIKLTSVFVNDQNKALEFYTKNLGFVKKADIGAGNYRWLTVVSSEDPNGPQLVLGPNDNPAAKSYQESIFKQGIPASMFFVNDIQKEYQRINKLGVKFKELMMVIEIEVNKLYDQGGWDRIAALPKPLKLKDTKLG